MRFLSFNPRRWDLIAINPFDFGLSKFVDPTEARSEFENFIKILEEIGEVKDICLVIDKEKLVSIVLESLNVIGENKIDENVIRDSISSLDKDNLCSLFILNPTVVISQHNKIRIFAEKIRGELLWLHRYAIIDNSIIIGYPSINTTKNEIKLLHYSLYKETNSEPIIAEYPPALLNFDDVIIDKYNNLLMAQIGGQTNVEGISKLFKLKYSNLAEVYLNGNYNKLPLSAFFRIINEDYVIVNKNILDNTRIDIYENLENNYHYKRTYTLRDFLNLFRKKVIIIENSDISFLIVNGKAITKNDEKIASILRNLGYDVISVKMSELCPTYYGPYNLVLTF